VEIAPVIDGILDEVAWETLPADTGFLSVFNETFGVHYPPTQQCRMKLGFDADHLYFGVICEEPWIKYLKEDRSEEKAFEKDDGIEVFLEPEEGGKLFHFIVNARGGAWSNLDGMPGSDPDMKWVAKTFMGEDYYSIEMKVPLAILGDPPEDGEVWRGNVGRNILTINCPENRKTSWSPVKEKFEARESFGNFSFVNEAYSAKQSRDVEAELKARSDRNLRIIEEQLEDFQETEAAQLEAYFEEIKTRPTGVIGITRGKADLVEPPGVPEGETWRYGLGFPLQISPTEAALLTNIRMIGTGNIDFEIGTDVVLFDDLSEIGTERVVVASRFERGVDPELGPYVVRKGPILGGFVPMGALLEDGSPHPHAGTGFGMCWAIRHIVDAEGKFDYLHNVERYAEMFQFAYDGMEFRVLDRRPVDAATLLGDWNLVGNFVTNAIPDGQDLLYVMIARVGEVAIAGVTRWQYGVAGWHPVSFTPVTGEAVTWSEPSLVREADGSLLLSARSHDRADPIITFDIGIWRSTNNGNTWTQTVYEKDRRARSPVSVNLAADGSPFIAANTPPIQRRREILCLWPLNESRNGLDCRMTARDAPVEFGPAPSGSWWRIDHPNSAVLRLADGVWHGVLAYRIVDNGEVEGDAPPSPQTGCYVEEVLSKGKAVPTWNFSMNE